MNDKFNSCKSLFDLNEFSSWDTTDVISINGIFSEC